MKAPCPLVGSFQRPWDLAALSFSTLRASYIPISLYFGCDKTECISLCFCCSFHRRSSVAVGDTASQKIRLGTPSATRMHGLLLTTCRYLMPGRRLKPHTRPLDRGTRGDYTHDHHTRCDFALGCSRCSADAALQLRLGILPKRRSRPRCSDPCNPSASWAHIKARLLNDSSERT